MATSDIIGGLLGYTGSIIGAAAQQGAVEMTNKAQKELAQYSFEQQREMIREQNEYNSPLNQMKRYEEAGLNPNLIYGNGASSAGLQTETAKYHAPDLKVPQLGEVMQAAINFGLARREMALKDQELQNKREEQFNLRSIRNGIDLDNAEKSVLLDYNPGIVLDVGSKDAILNSKKLKQYDLGIEARQAEIAYTNARKALASVDARYRQNIIDKFQEKQLELLNAQVEGRNIENEIQAVERDLQKSLNNLGGRTGVKIIVDLLRAILK